MRNCIRNFTATVVAFAFLTLASTAWASDWRTLSLTVTNSTTTPAPAGQERIPEGALGISCDAQWYQPIQKDEVVTSHCSVRRGEALALTYSVHLGVDDIHYGTADIDCLRYAELTFSGSGEAVTFTHSCADPDPVGDDSGSDSGSGDDGGDDSGGADGGDSGGDGGDSGGDGGDSGGDSG